MTPVIANGIFLRDTTFSMSNHLDEAHLFSMKAERKPTDLGVFDIWAMTQKKEMPLYSMSSFNDKNTLYTDTKKYTFRHPIATDMPYIVEDISDQEEPGRGGSTFQIKLNINAYGHGAILTYDKYNGLEMYVTDEPILKVNDGYVYTVKLVNQSSDQFMDKRFLKPQTKIFRVTSVRTEHTTHYDDFLIDGGGFREFYNHVGDYESTAQFSVSKYAEAGAHSVDEHRNQITELWRVDGAYIDPSVNKLPDFMKLKGKDYLADKIKSGAVSVQWAPKLEMAAMKKIATDIETYLMWGKGGLISNVDGPKDIRMSTGLWRQLDRGYKRVYTRDTFNLEMFEAEIFNFFRGKVNFDGPDSQNKLIVQTGMAGMKMMNNAIHKMVNATGLIQNATDIGAVYGSHMNLGYGMNYTQYKIPFLANLEFVINPAFDNVEQNTIENPTVDGYNLSSYSFIIYDFNVMKGNDNIVLLKYAPGGNRQWSDIQWHYQQGDFPYLGIGAAKGFASVGDFSGYRVKMSQIAPAIIVKDPTKVLKFVMKNPITGGSL